MASLHSGAIPGRWHRFSGFLESQSARSELLQIDCRKNICAHLLDEDQIDFGEEIEGTDCTGDRFGNG
jgi:hypothetical protein